jgi:hypothetical protein
LVGSLSTVGGALEALPFTLVEGDVAVGVVAGVLLLLFTGVERAALRFDTAVGFSLSLGFSSGGSSLNFFFCKLAYMLNQVLNIEDWRT